MPIETPAQGTLEVENAKFRASSLEATEAVGIGTESNSAYPLQVFKETAPDIRIREGSTISSAAILYSNNSNLYIQTGADFTAGSSGDVAFQTMGGQTTHMVIKNDGKVGVGTASPNQKAHIYVDDAASGAQLFIENASTSNRAGLVLKNANGEGFNIQHTVGNSNAAILENFSTVNGGVEFYAKGDGDYQFRTTDANTVRMAINNDGNVGIGTANPGAKLDVRGTLRAPGVPVQFVSAQVHDKVAYSSAASTHIDKLDITITPHFSNSKIYLTWRIEYESNWDAVFRIYRDSTLIGYNTVAGNVGYSGVTTAPYDNNDSSTPQQTIITWIDSPNTTNSVTYKVYFQGVDGSRPAFYLNRSVSSAGTTFYENGVSQKTAMEIAQ